MRQISTRYITTGVNEELSCDITLSSEGNANSITMRCSRFSFTIQMKDSVDLDDFYKFLNKKHKRISLFCTLSKPDKEYKGEKKIVWKNNTIAVSQGGIRLEFGSEAVSLLTGIVKSLKS